MISDKLVSISFDIVYISDNGVAVALCHVLIAVNSVIAASHSIDDSRNIVPISVDDDDTSIDGVVLSTDSY